jgi:hypothetical protein
LTHYVLDALVARLQLPANGELNGLKVKLKQPEVGTR